DDGGGVLRRGTGRAVNPGSADGTRGGLLESGSHSAYRLLRSAGKEEAMRIDLRVGVLGLALVAPALLIAPAPGYSQTPGMERRSDRRQDRNDARATRQTGRETGRENKQACRDAGGNP